MTTFYCDKCGGYIGGDLPDIKDMKVCTCDIEINLPPQKQPFRCPVCGGSGIVNERLYNLYPLGTTANNTQAINCRSCNGTGIVWG